MEGRKVNRKTYIGQKFNNLTIQSIEENSTNPANDLAYCICDCGNNKIAKFFFVIRGDIKSCGCLRKNKTFKKNDYSSMVNQTYDRLTVISIDGAKANCKCICGEFKTVPAKDLLSEHIKSCGCLKPKVNVLQKEMKCSECFEIKPFTKDFFEERANGELKSKCLICSGAHLKRFRVKVKDMTPEYYENKKNKRKRIQSQL